MTFVRSLMLLVFVAASCGCHRKTDAQSTAATATAANDKREDDKPADFSHFDTKRLERLWQGAWVVENQGRLQAWHVRGDRVTVFNGTEKKERILVFPTPCEVGISAVSPSGHYTELVSFAADGDTLYAGHGDSGYRQGTDLVACASAGVWTQIGATCTLWRQEIGPGKMVWKRKTATCETSKDASGELVELTSPAAFPTSKKLRYSGQALVGGLVKLTRYASLDEAVGQLEK